MAKVPRVTAAQVIRARERAGFFLARHPKLLKSILRDAELTPEDFQDLLS